MRTYFKDIFISDSIGYDKPAREFFRAVEDSIDGFDSSRALIIGDSISSDIKGGINYGIDTCWISPCGKAAPDGMNITYIIKHLFELYDILGVRKKR